MTDSVQVSPVTPLTLQVEGNSLPQLFENAGRTLHHVAVVRVLKDFGSGATDGRRLRLSNPSLLSQKKDGEPLRLVVFLVSNSKARVVAVAEQTLPQ